MSKYILHYSELNKRSEIYQKSFTSAKKRLEFIADKVISIEPKRVFTLIVGYDDNDVNAQDVYTFDQWSCIQDIVKTRWKTFYLYEWKSYEEAYKYALDIKEVHPLCYTN